MDWDNPDYAGIYTARMKRLRSIRAEPEVLPVLRSFYAANPIQFIDDWGVTIDPRNAVVDNRPVMVPFVLFPKQREWLEWTIERWMEGKPGLSEKSRDCGLSWLSVALGSTLCMFRPDINIGYGSRKEEYVDASNAPKSLFWKARQFIENLPIEFNGGWSRKRHSSHKLITFPATNSTMTGEAGDGIGRGDRATLYFVDESAFLERPQLVEASLSQTTNCRIDISSANGLDNPFAEKRHGGKIKVFTFHWRDDPRKDDAWYAKQVEELDPVTVAQEIDINYAASVEGVLIPSAWIQASIDAHIKLGIVPTGKRRGAFDVADEGKDFNAFAGSTGILVDRIEQWTGKGSDIFASTERVFDLCDDWGISDFKYDADGLGADVRGNARVINERRQAASQTQLSVLTFRGSSDVARPEGEDVVGRKNKDFFMNRKAQSWWALRRRFYKTYRAVIEGDDFIADDIISIASDLPMRAKLTMELSQPTYVKNSLGKIVVDKAPTGQTAKSSVKSPNLADSVMMLFGEAKGSTMKISDDALGAI